MSLKDKINNTNTQKDKLKRGKGNIDNKLVELGGEKSVNISDVPYKIEKMTKKYSRLAKSSFVEGINQVSEWYTKRVQTSLRFNPQIIFAIVSLENPPNEGLANYSFLLTTKSDITAINSNSYIAVNIKNPSKFGFDVEIKWDYRVSEQKYPNLKLKVEWIAYEMF